MKKEDIPQDNGAIGEMAYAVDKDGRYTTAKTNGWEVKIDALGVAWSDIEKKVAAAKAKVINNEASPILYFMELKIMDLPILAGYTGFWQWQIKRHLKPAGFASLSDKKLHKYAEAFEISIEELKNTRQILLQQA